MDPVAQSLLNFWLRELSPEAWFRVDEVLDARIRETWQPTWEIARAGGLREWAVGPESALALVILLDQLPRNMFRGQAVAFSTDRRAIAVARQAILQGFDTKIELSTRSFFYLPFMHSEVLADQDRSVRLNLLAYGRGPTLDHARAHREIIRRFGRFPYRNAALGRETTPEEQRFLDAGGYAAIVDAIAA